MRERLAATVTTRRTVRSASFYRVACMLYARRWDHPYCRVRHRRLQRQDEVLQGTPAAAPLLQYARKLHCRSVEICCFTTAKRQLMLMLPRVDQVDDSNVQIFCTATAVVSAGASLSVSERGSVSLSLCSSFSLSRCVCVCVLESAWMRTVCLAVE